MENNLRSLAEDAIRSKTFPGVVIAYATPSTRRILPYGKLTYGDNSRPVTSDTIYDLASVTKVIPTNSIILLLIDEGRLSAEDKVVDFIPELDNSFKDQLLVRHLLTFTMLLDLPEGLKKYICGGAQAIITALFQADLKYPPGQSYHYSNPPSILLGMIAERLLGKPLDAIANELLFAPLNMASTTFYPEKLDRNLIAPTEINERGEVKGKVHDETAWALHEGGIIAGHAGAFSSANDLLNFGSMVLNDGEFMGRRIFSAAAIQAFSEEILNNGDVGMALGWDMRQPYYMGTRISPKTFGKVGFTGTSFLIEPEKKICLVILSNRTYPKRPASSDAINAFRRCVAEEIFLSQVLAK